MGRVRGATGDAARCVPSSDGPSSEPMGRLPIKNQRGQICIFEVGAAMWKIDCRRGIMEAEQFNERS